MAAAILLCGALGGCTLSDSLRHDDFRSVWSQPGNATTRQTVIFATDREPDGSTLGYGLHWDGASRCGTAEVEIPSAFGPGLAPHFAEAKPPNPVACDRSGDMDGFAAAVADAAKARHCTHVLLFIHGYNQTFPTAVFRTAQLATDTQWRCAIALFSWSSEGKVDRYAADIERSGYAVPELIEALRSLAAKGVTADIVAHSMGARVTLTALAALCARRTAPLAGQVLFAAPDVSAELYNDDFGHLLGKSLPCLTRATIYASDNDLVLATSESAHGGIPRAGRGPERDLQYVAGGKVDVVDASAAPGDPFGHGIFALSYEMLDDMMWTLAGMPIARRAAADAPGGPTLDCPKDGCDGKRYALRVADARGPDFKTRLLRRIWPLIFHVQ